MFWKGRDAANPYPPRDEPLTFDEFYAKFVRFEDLPLTDVQREQANTVADCPGVQVMLRVAYEIGKDSVAPGEAKHAMAVLARFMVQALLAGHGIDLEKIEVKASNKWTDSRDELAAFGSDD